MKLVLIIAAVIIVLPLVYLYAIMPGTRDLSEIERLKSTLYAHRGLFDNHSDAPENSMNAFAKAVEAGYGIEMDIQVTKDKQVVVFHDFLLARILRNEDGLPVLGKIRDYTYEELQKYHLLKSDQKIPLFAEVLKLVDGKVPLIVELKIENLDFKVPVCSKADALLKNYKGLYCIESFHPAGIYWYKKHRPDIVRGQLADMYTRDKEQPKKHFLLYLLMQNLMLNFLTRPDFVAYNRKYPKNISRRLCRHLYHNTAAAWTIKSEDQLQEARKHFDLYIFDSFIPKDPE